jgi:hypothetical protein
MPSRSSTRRFAVSFAMSLVLALAAVAGAAPAGVAPEAKATTAFVGVTVVPADSARVIANQTVLVRGGRITALGPAAKVKIPAGAIRVDGEGKFLMPGLADMHVRLPEGSASEMTSLHLGLYVVNGITTVRGMLGAPDQLGLRDRVDKGEVLGPRLFVWSPTLGGQNTATPEAAALRVKEYKKAGYDGIRIYEGLKSPTFDAIARTARQLKIPFGGQVPNAVGLERVLASGQSSVDHLDGYVEALEYGPLPEGEVRRVPVGVASTALLELVKEDKLPALAQATRAAKVAVVPTQSLWRTLYGDAELEGLRNEPELRFFPVAEEWIERKAALESKAPPVELRRRLMSVRAHAVKAIADAGGTVLLGTDAPQLFAVPGYALRSEALALAAAGLSPWQVLEAATSAAARFLGVDKDVGTVAVGKRADLLLVNGNPLEDVGAMFRVSGVMVRGLWLPRAALDERLVELERLALGLRFPPAAEVKDLPIAPAEAAPLAGNYASASTTLKLVVALDKGGLMLTTTEPAGTKTNRMRAQGGGTYLVPELKARVTFERDGGNATALLLLRGESQLRAARSVE